eukprot:5326542-Alexandrium_andersonii.AAC.1
MPLYTTSLRSPPFPHSRAVTQRACLVPELPSSASCGRQAGLVFTIMFTNMLGYRPVSFPPNRVAVSMFC